jgi:TPR repeat protein
VALLLASLILILVLVCALAFCWVKFGWFSSDPSALIQSGNAAPVAESTAAPEADALPSTIPELVQLADAGNGRASFELGERYRQGRGVVMDERMAFRWYVKAGETGDAEVSFRLGVMFDAWESELSTSYRVFSYLESAALCGHQRAQLKLAELNLRNTLAELNLRNPREDPKDSQRFGNVVDAFAWLNICAAWGDEASAARRDELESEIKRAYTPATIAQCQVRSRQLLKIIESNKTSAIKVTVLPAREN